MTDQSSMMKAVVLKQSGFSKTATGPVIENGSDWMQLADVPQPQPGPKQVLIKMIMASINPSDCHFVKGEYGIPRVEGAAAGFEGVGTVVAVGAGAEKLQGQRVSFIVSPTGSGAWAEYALTEAAMCVPLHPDVADEDGAGQIVNPLTALAMMKRAKAHSDGVVITAATSQLGKLMLELSKDMDMKAIAVCRREDAREKLLSHGADEVLVPGSQGFIKSTLKAMKTFKPRMMLDCVGDQATADLFAMMPNRSRWVSYGKLDSQMPMLTAMGQFIFMNKQIEGFWLNSYFAETPLPEQIQIAKDVQQRFMSGKWTTDVAVKLPLTELVDKIASALDRKDGKIMVVFP